MTMTYLQNKKPARRYIIILWAALAALVFFNKSRAIIQNAIVQTEMFLLPERVALKESINVLAFLEQVKALKSENQKLKEALGAQSNRRSIPARVKFGGGYLFTDSVFVDEGLNAGIKENDIVLTESNILIGRIAAAGKNWSKVETAAGIGQKLTLVGEHPNSGFEAKGLGGGELAAELPLRLGSVFKPGDVVRWAENYNYVVGLVDKVDFKEGSSFVKLLINSPISPTALTWVKIVSNND